MPSFFPCRTVRGVEARSRPGRDRTDKVESQRLRNTGLVVSSLEGNWRRTVHGKVCTVTVFTSQHEMGGKTVRTNTGVVPMLILVTAVLVGGSR
jgi:hypothetical protein